MNLFELSAQYKSLMDEVMDSEELSSELIESLESINDSLENKVFNYTAMVKSLRAKAKSIDDVVNDMMKRYGNLMKSAEYFENQIRISMDVAKKDKIENEYHEVKLILNNARVAYNDREIVPKEFWRHKIKEVLEPDTSMISKALKEGIEVPGAYLVRDTRLSIR